MKPKAQDKPLSEGASCSRCGQSFAMPDGKVLIGESADCDCCVHGFFLRRSSLAQVLTKSRSSFSRAAAGIVSFAVSMANWRPMHRGRSAQAETGNRRFHDFSGVFGVLVETRTISSMVRRRALRASNRNR